MRLTFLCSLTAVALVLATSTAQARQAQAAAPAAATDPTVLHVVTTELPAAGKDVPYSSSLQAMGGSAPYRWVVVGGGLPPGYMLDPDTGVISGKTSQVGVHYATFRLSDATSSVTVRQTLGITVLKKLPPAAKTE